MVKNKCPEHLKEVVDSEIKIHCGKGYHKIVDSVKSKYGISIKTCYVADRKRALGYSMRRAWNSGL